MIPALGAGGPEFKSPCGPSTQYPFVASPAIHPGKDSHSVTFSGPHQQPSSSLLLFTHHTLETHIHIHSHRTHLTLHNTLTPCTLPIYTHLQHACMHACMHPGHTRLINFHSPYLHCQHFLHRTYQSNFRAAESCQLNFFHSDIP